MPNSVWSVTSAPAAEPLLRAYVKNWLKIPSAVTTDDDLVDDLIVAARQFVERHTSRALITQTITEFWDDWPAERTKDPRVLLPTIAPVQGVTSVAYLAEGAASDTDFTVLGASNYVAELVSGMNAYGGCRIYLAPDVNWPDLEDEYKNRVRVVYVAGYGASGSSVPGMIRQAMLRLIGIWYYGRDDRNMNDYEVVAQLLDPYKVHK